MVVKFDCIPLTLTLSWHCGEGVRKAISQRRKEGRVENNERAAFPQGPGLEHGTYCMAADYQ